MKRKLAVVGLVILLLVLVCIGWQYKGVFMAEKVMMEYGNGFNNPNEETFDATKWFASGMYRRDTKRDPIEIKEGLPEIKMFRNEIPPVKDGDELHDLRIAIHVGLDASQVFDPDIEVRDNPLPHDFEFYVLHKDFDPRPQLFYHLSFFEDIDKPVDRYKVFFLIKCQRIYMTIDRDPLTGEFVNESRDYYLSAPIGKTNEEIEKLLEALEIKAGCPLKNESLLEWAQSA